MSTTDLTAPPGADYPRQELGADGDRVRNWARNATLARTRSVSAPEDEDALRRLLATTTGPVRMIGSRMSPGRMLAAGGDAGTLLDLGRLTGLVALDAATATFAGATTLGEVYATLAREGRTLAAAPGVISEQTLAGALSTGTHGQGLRQSCIADAATRIRMVLADGSTSELRRGDAWFGAAKVGLGVLGVITEVTLRTVPSLLYTCRKDALDASGLADDLVAWNTDHLMTKAWWFPDERQVHVWRADEASAAEAERYHAGGDQLLEQATTSDALNDAVEAALHHMRGDTRILDADGKPFQTVNRFKDFSDVTGDVYQVFTRGIATPQINVEIGVPLDRAGEVVRAIEAWHAATRPHMHYPVILRCTGGSDSWLSPAYGTPTCYFGFVVYYAEDGTLAPDGVAFLREVERLLAVHGGRPHWGKYYDESLYDWPTLYPRWASFQGVREALDPGHRFDNAFTAALLA
ncbi:D-arabinono-1,4-lactone oxidase [Microlunatus flavus]|uniref:FAD/FMN-containing dehydrogenase n=1 Tax=Microlunatus flavus TaxID=1036181 RepID=A0A1H9J476_9ACTN|nr:D-arabinono-1,4-lactone oxidase [Microlunatus flavus]SEQ81680.1 FAD/FMN-containing dehydrogenase [Microlunatus flavus]